MKQDLRMEEVFRVLRDLEGKNSNDQIAHILDDLGLIEIDVWELKKAKTGQFVRAYRQRCRKNRDVQHDLIHLTEESDDGSKADYYLKFNELNTDQHIEHLKWWDRRMKNDRKIFYMYFDSIPKDVRKKVQRDLPFDLPARPEALAPVEA